MHCGCLPNMLLWTISDNNVWQEALIRRRWSHLCKDAHNRLWRLNHIYIDSCLYASHVRENIVDHKWYLSYLVLKICCRENTYVNDVWWWIGFPYGFKMRLGNPHTGSRGKDNHSRVNSRRDISLPQQYVYEWNLLYVCEWTSS